LKSKSWLTKGTAVPKLNGLSKVQPTVPVTERDRREIIRFASGDDRREAIGALIDYGMLNFTSYRDEEWLVRTPVARKLRELGVPFDWLTENA
jgi:hypothetical protein